MYDLNLTVRFQSISIEKKNIGFRGQRLRYFFWSGRGFFHLFEGFAREDGFESFGNICPTVHVTIYFSVMKLFLPPAGFSPTGLGKKNVLIKRW